MKVKLVEIVNSDAGWKGTWYKTGERHFVTPQQDYPKIYANKWRAIDIFGGIDERDCVEVGGMAAWLKCRRKQIHMVVTSLIPIRIQRDVMSGQCKGALLRFQVRYTAVFFFPGWIRGWAGSQIGFFTPRKTENGYECTGFYFRPWLAPDIAVVRLPSWYVRLANALSFRFE